MSKQNISADVVERELDAHLRLLLNQARRIIAPTFDVSAGDYAVENFSECVSAIILAMAEIRKTSRAEEKRLAAVNECDHVHFFVDFDHIVASATASLIDRILVVENWSPYSVGAAPFIVFAKAYTASRLAGALEFEVSEWESLGDPEVALKAISRGADGQ